MKRIKTLFRKEAEIKRILGIAAFILIFSINGFVSEAAEGKVIANTAYIRSEASTNSEVVGSTVKGKTIDIVGAVKDSSGTVWYKVPNGNNTYGYVRSDLIETSEEIKITEASAETSSGGSTSKPADTVPTSIGEQQATISVESAKIRSGASTQHDTITSLPKGTVITLVGEANDSTGKKWYQMTCDYNGRTVQGYVRYDLIEVGAVSAGEGSSEGSEGENPESGENPEGSEGENQEGGENPEEAEGGQPETSEENKDYEIIYREGAYWLYDYVGKHQYDIKRLLQDYQEQKEKNETLNKQQKTGKIIMIVLAVIIVLLVIVVTVLLIKLRDAYYYEDDDEEEEEEEEIEEEPVAPKRTRRRPAEDYEENPAPVRRKSSSERQETDRPVRQRNGQSAELQAAERSQSAKRPTKRKTQNFLVDDDEFEFEFLNMDDKDV